MRSGGGRGTGTQITHGGGLDAQESSDGRFIYYAKAQSPTAIWRMPIGGGEPVQVIDGLSYPLNFIVSDDGIYFVAVGNTESETSINFFDFRTGARTSRATLAKPWSYGVGLSPDRRWLLFSVIDRESQDWMMVNRAR
jgi:Tol biopolymer transport system component